MDVINNSFEPIVTESRWTAVRGSGSSRKSSDAFDNILRGANKKTEAAEPPKAEEKPVVAAKPEKENKLTEKAAGDLDRKEDLKTKSAGPVQPKDPMRPPQVEPIAQPSTPESKTWQGTDAEDITELESINEASLALKPETVDDLGRRSALQTFMRRMKTELNVDATQIVAAFASLNIEDLSQPPQANIEKLVEALPIEASQKPLARQIMADMIRQTDANSFADYVKGSGRQLSIQVMSRGEVERQNLSQSLDQMNSRFFVNNQNLKGEKPALNNLQQQQAQKKDENGTLIAPEQAAESKGMSTGEKALFGAMLAAPAYAAAKSAEGSSQAGAKTAAAPAKSVGQAPTPEDTLDELNLDDLSDEELVQLQKLTEDLSMSAEAMPMPAAVAGKNTVKVAASQDAPILNALNLTGDKAIAAASASGDKKSSDSKADRESANSNPVSNFADPSLNVEGAKNQAKGAIGGASMFATTQASDADQAANVKEMVTHAETLIRKGGGEMKLNLNPEGLGKMTMKVSVHNGQVAVEMITENHTAKKVLEKGLIELKETLAAHQLNVDQIKVDTASDLSKQLSQRYDDANRHQQQQFMEQFRQDNQQWRQGFFDITGAKAYKSQTRDRADNDLVQAQSADRKKASSRRLDLVA